MNYPLLSEYIESVKLAEDNFEELKHLRPVLDEDGKPVMSSGNFAVVFKMKDDQTGKLHAVKCFLKEQESRAAAYRMIAEELESVNSTYLTPINYLDKELFVDSNVTKETEFPILLMDWVEGQTLDKYIRENIDDQYALEMLAYQFSRLAMWLLPQPFAHGDLKPDNIIVREDGSLVLVDYDGMYVPAMKGQKARELGSPDFRHPSRTADEFNEHIDDFPIASILLSLKAIALQPDLLEEYGSKDRLLLSEADYRSISQSRFFKQVFPSDNMELNKLMNLFMLALSENNLSEVSSNLFNLQKPEDVVYTTEVMEEDLANAWVDEFGVKYSADRKRLLEAPNDLTNYIIRKGTVVICDDSFYCCYNLVSIVIPNSVKIIGDFAFGHCSSLASVNLPDTVTNINEYAFSDCDSLNSVFLPPLISILREGVFCGCSGLISIVIPETVKIIEDNTFSGCKGLSSIVIPSSVSSIGNYSFQGCSGLASIIVEKGNSFYDSRNYCNAIIETKSNMLIAGCLSTIIPNDVSVISDGAFNGCSGLTSIMIPRSVTNIGNRSFYGCSGLTSITIPDSVNSIGNRAFEACGSLKSITLFDGVESLGYSSFSCCTSLTSIFIPSSVTYIGRMAFLYCEALSSVTFTNSEIIIEEGVFGGCKNLKSIFIQRGTREKFERLLPEYKDKLVEQDDSDVYSTEVTEEDLANAWVDEFGVKYSADRKRLLKAPNSMRSYSIRKGTIIICNYAFSADYITPNDRYSNRGRGLNNISIPEGIKAIGSGAFWGCVSLESIDIPMSVKTIGKDAFYSCYSLSSMVIPNKVSRICESTFQDCIRLKSIIVPNSVKSIGKNAFWGCVSLDSMTIPDDIVSIDKYTFKDCRSLKVIHIPDGVITIGDESFCGCSKLTSITIPGSVAEISFNAFNNCGALTSIKVNKNNKYYDSRNNCNAIVETNSNTLIVGCSNTIIPSDIVFICKRAFNGCQDLTSISIPEGVKTIEESTFENCSNLTSITIPDGLYSIGDRAFSGCYSLKSIRIPDSVKLIGDWAFSLCDRLKAITIPKGVTIIGKGVFNGCKSLSSITIPEEVTSIGNHAFCRCGSLLTITIPKGVTTIEECVFNGCENLSSVSIPKSVTAIGDFAFEDCEKLLSIEIPNNVTTIGNRAFYGCGRLTSITIPGRVTNIGDRAFSKCYSLTSIKVINNKHYDSRNNCNAIIETNSNALIVGCLKTIIPSSVSTISKRAFDGYSHLTSITIPEGVQYIEDDAFYDCYLSTVFLSNSIISIGNDAFSLNTCPDYRFRIIIPNGTNEKYEKLLPKYKDNILEKEVYLFKLKTKVTDDDFI